MPSARPIYGSLCATVAFLLVGCSPTLSERCENDGHCLVGEYCQIPTGATGHCVEGQRDVGTELDVTPGGVPADDDFEVDTDLVDSTGGEEDGDESVSSDVVDVEVAVDGANPDEVDAGSCPTENRYAYTMEVPIGEYCGAGSPSSCEEPTADLANCVQSAYAAQLIEVPLRNGILDASVSVYYTFERVDESGSWLSEVNGRIASQTDASTGPQALSQAAYGDSLSFTAGAAASGRDWTLAFWFRIEDWSDGSGTLLSTRESAEDGTFLELSYQFDEFEGELSFQLSGEEGGSSEMSIPDHTSWHHLALTSEKGGALLVYLDGRPAQLVHTLPSFLMNESQFHFGYDGQHTSGILGGIDEVIFMHRALSPLEVRTMEESAEGFGQQLLPEAAPDLLDVRLLSGDGLATPEPFEIVGVRPGPPPGFNDEIDCYINFNNIELEPDDDVTEARTGLIHPSGSCFGPARGEYRGEHLVDTEFSGRFGYDQDRAIKLSENDFFEIPWAPPDSLDSADFALEFWVRADQEGIILELGNITISETDSGSFEVAAGSSLPIGDSAGWHHLALIVTNATIVLVVDGKPSPNLCEDDGMDCTSFSFGLTPRLSFGSPSGGSFAGRIDDFVLFQGERHVEEFRRRSTPSIPVLRFFAETKDGGEGCPQQFPNYAIAYGNSDPVNLSDRSSASQCVGLLSHCDGYVAWWRFDQTESRALDDLTSNGIHLAASDEGMPTIVHHDTGRALALLDPQDDGSRRLYGNRTGDTDIHWETGESVTIDATFVADSDGIILAYEDSDGFAEFALLVTDANALLFCSADLGAAEEVCYVTSVSTITRGQPHHVTVSLTFGEDSATAWLDGEPPLTMAANFEPEGLSLPTASIFMVGSHQSGANGLNGSIGEARILSRPPATNEHLGLNLLESEVWLHRPASSVPDERCIVDTGH